MKPSQAIVFLILASIAAAMLATWFGCAVRSDEVELIGFPLQRPPHERFESAAFNVQSEGQRKLASSVAAPTRARHRITRAAVSTGACCESRPGVVSPEPRCVFHSAVGCLAQSPSVCVQETAPGNCRWWRSQ